MLPLKKGVKTAELLSTTDDASKTRQAIDSNINFQKVVIKAKSWGQISITPGSWYDSSIISLASSSLSAQLYKQFFGPDGLLASRVSSFYVAYQVEITFFTQGMNQSDIKNLYQSSDIQALGISVKPKQIEASDRLELVAVSPDPVIVAVGIEPMNRGG